MKLGYPEIYKPEPVVPDLFPNEGNTLFIFGNGLDIDLGYPTKYKDYFESDFFPFVHNDHTCHALGHFVYDRGAQAGHFSGQLLWRVSHEVLPRRKALKPEHRFLRIYLSRTAQFLILLNQMICHRVAPPRTGRTGCDTASRSARGLKP